MKAQIQLFVGGRVALDDGAEAEFIGGVMTNDDHTLILVEDGNRRRQWIRLTTDLRVVDSGSIESASADRNVSDRVKSALIRRSQRR